MKVVVVDDEKGVVSLRIVDNQQYSLTVLTSAARECLVRGGPELTVAVVFQGRPNRRASLMKTRENLRVVQYRRDRKG